MKITKIVGNQRVVVDVDVRNPAAFARAINAKDLVSTTIRTIATSAEQSVLIKTLGACVRPFAIAIVQQIQEKQ